MLTGMFAGSVPFGYKLTDVRPGLLIITNEDNKNRYSINIGQISGEE